MVAWYKHDIPAWMDGTEALDDGPYRTYHVICQLIYLGEGPITLNEHGIAGRCKQTIRAFRRNLKVLLELGKLTLVDGRLNNSRTEKELEKVCDNRMNAAEGGIKSGEVRNANAKILKSLTSGEAPLELEKTRLDKTRLDKTKDTSTVAKKATPRDEHFEEFRKSYPRRLGPDPRSPAEKLFLAAVKAGADPQAIITGARRCAQIDAKNVGTPYIPQMQKWLRDKRWVDYTAEAEVIKFDVRRHLI